MPIEIRDIDDGVGVVIVGQGVVTKEDAESWIKERVKEKYGIDILSFD